LYIKVERVERRKEKMAKKINTVTELHDYLKGVAERAEHHAKSVEEVIYPALCLIIAYFEPNSDIEVREYKGNMANVLWAYINGTKYAFVYEHTTSVIEIRKDSEKGQVMHSINNNFTVKELISIFNSL
jgi:hypothetical protein